MAGEIRVKKDWRSDSCPKGSDMLRRLSTRLMVDDGCWLWAGATHMGYGVVRWEGKNWRVHRVVYELLVGPIPEGLVIDHLCQVKACARPDHLEAVTCAENNRRAKALLTHCLRGHPLSGDNLRFGTQGQRVCIACKKYWSDVRSAERAKVRQQRREAMIGGG